MELQFTKMHGTGNDFVVIDAVSQPVSLTPDQLRRLADRHLGVGCDQVLMIERPSQAGADFRYRIFNADGGEVEQCGNGARCFARFVHDRGLTTKDDIRVQTLGGAVGLCILPDGRVTVDMGVPRFDPAVVPFQAPAAAPTYELQTRDHGPVRLSVLSMGNPHAVLVVDDVASAPVAALGTEIGGHPRFPQGVNVGFMQVVDRDRIKLRVWERGAGETLACGSGACAAAVTGRRLDRLDEQVAVELPGGTVTIQWEGDDRPVRLTGPVAYVFEGRIEL